MPKSAIPGPLERRHLVVGELPAARCLAIAEACLAEGRDVEAVDFLVKAGEAERLAELRARAVEAGDAFLLRALAAAMEAPPSRDEWSQLAAAAAAAGKERYAEDARRQAQREEE